MATRLIPSTHVDSWEDDLRAAFASAVSRQRSSVEAALHAHGLTWDSPAKDTAADLWSQSAWQASLDAEMLPVSKRIAGQIVSALRQRAPGLRGLQDMTSVLAQRPINRALAGGSLFQAKMSRSPLTAAGVDVAAVSQAVAEAPSRYGGVVHPDSISTVADAYQAAHAQLADVVARVTAAMSNEAITILGQTASDQSGSLIQHVWTTMGDDAVREDHLDAEGQTQDVGDPFDVGGEDLMYPGDPSGSDSNICNCRCMLDTIGLEAAGVVDEEAVG